VRGRMMTIMNKMIMMVIVEMMMMMMMIMIMLMCVESPSSP